MIRWWQFWRNLKSLLARRRAWRRKLPNRPVIKPVIGGVIDEQRKIAIVLEILDDTHWRGEWNGQVYECRQFPDTSNLTIGDAVVVHAMPNSTELWSTWFPSGGPELWFSPGSDDTNERGTVWRCFPTPGGTQYEDYTIEQVWQGTDDYEYATHICWSKAAGKGYVFTWWANDWRLRNARLRAYRIEQDAVAPSITLVHEVGGAAFGLLDDTIEPVLDSCQFLDTCYVMCGGMLWVSCVLQFDLTTETFSALSHDFPLAGGAGGGITTDSGNGIMYAHDGMDLYSTPDAINWTWLLNIKAECNCEDVMSMIQEYTTPQIYGGLVGDDDPGEENAVFTLSEPGEVFAVDYSMADPTHYGMVALANQWNAAGEITITWAQQMGYIGGPTPGPEVYQKPIGGAWALDWTGPPNTGPAPGLNADAYIGLGTQGIVYFDTQIWILAWNWRLFSTHAHETVLYRRDAAGAWNLMETWVDRYMCSTWRRVTGMAPLPSIGAGPAELAMMRRQHEVN